MAVKLVAAAFLVTGLLVGAAGLALSPFLYFLASDRILPGVHFDGLSLAGLTREQAAAALENSWNSAPYLTLSDGLRSWTSSTQALGLSIDAQALSISAYNYGRSERLLGGTLLMYAALQDGWEPEPVVTLDEQLARAGLQSLASQVYVAPMDANLTLENGRLVERPAVQGFALDIDQTLDWLRQNQGPNLFQGSLPLFLTTVPAQVQDVSLARAEAERLLTTPVQFLAFDPISGETQPHTVPVEEVASWLRIHSTPSGPEVGLDEARLLDYLAAWSESLLPSRWLDLESISAPDGSQTFIQAVRRGEPLTFRVRHSPSVYTVVPGDTLVRISWRLGLPYWMLLEANPGLDSEALYPGQVLAVPSKDDLLPLPVVPNKRIVLNISQQRMWTYQDGGLLWEFIISTGIDRSPTQPGVFQVQSHHLNAYASVWDLYMPHFIGIYEAWPGFMNGIHGLPTLSNGQRLWANILGRPASYGCIILGLQEAEQLYYWAEPGVVVEIQP